jgi:hypothetical protein
MHDHPDAGPYFLHSDSIVLLRHIFDVVCDTLRDQVTDTSKARIHGVVGLAIADMANRGLVDPDRLLKHALARARR